MGKHKKKRNQSWADKREDQKQSSLPGEPIWIHDRQVDGNSVTGYFYLPSCTCGVCGYHANMEKDVCPQCKSKMKRGIQTQE